MDTQPCRQIPANSRGLVRRPFKSERAFQITYRAGKLRPREENHRGAASHLVLETQVSSDSALELFPVQQGAHFHSLVSTEGLLHPGTCSSRGCGGVGGGVLSSHSLPGVAHALCSPPSKNISISAWH